MKHTNEIRELLRLIEKADGIILLFGDKKAMLGKDMQGDIVHSMRLGIETSEARTTDDTGQGLS